MHDPPPRPAPARGAAARRDRHFQTCLTCLTTDVRMCDLKQCNLGKSYAALVGYPCDAEEGMPDAVCYECARKLNKFKEFRAMSRRAYSLLQGLLDQYHKISESDIKGIDRRKSCLENSLTFCNLRHIDIQPTKEQAIYLEVKAEGGIYSEKNRDTLLNKAQNKDSSELVKSKGELKSVDKLDGDFEYDSDDEVLSPESSTIELTKPKQEDIKSVTKETRKTRSLKGGKNDRIIKKENNPKNCRSDKGKKATRKVKSEQPVKVKLNRKRPNAKTHTQYTKEYYEKIAVVTVMSQEQQMEFFKMSRSRYSKHPFCCDQCGMGFHSHNAFETHMQKHNPTRGDVVCDVCKTYYKNKTLLAKHICMFHRTKLECLKCAFVSSSHQFMRIHVSKKHPMPHFCDVCETMFDELKGYIDHIYGEHPASVACATCGVTVFNLAGLKKHRATVHHEPDESSVVSEVPCAQCGVAFCSEEAYNVHRNTYPGHDTEHGLIACGACSETSTDAAVLLQHMKKHGVYKTKRSSVTDIECEQCGKHFLDGRMYFRHFRAVHPDKTRTKYFGPQAGSYIMCEICGKLFQNSHMMRDHMDQHNDVRRYKCDRCDKRFFKSEHLKRHRHVHTKEQPFQCKICETRFTRLFNYQKHLNHVHTDATPYSCDVCGKSFKYRGTMTTHVQHVHNRRPWPKRDRTRRKTRTGETNEVIEELI